MPELNDLGPQLTKLLTELDRRAKITKVNNEYYSGDCPVPEAVITAKMRKAYTLLMSMAQAPWASLVVDSVQDRLEVGGVRTGDDELDKLLRSEVWQRNGLDAESKLGHNGALVDGRVAATVWPDGEGKPEVVLDPADHVVVQYIEGRHQARHRIAALRRWVDSDDNKQRVTLYRPEALYKLKESKEQTAGQNRVKGGGTFWEPRVELAPDGLPEAWPLENPYGVVPVIEIATNRRLKPGAFPYARGEFEHCTGLIDRINLLTFLGLVVALWMGFPLRGVIGEKILRDDDDNPLPPFDQKPDETVQFEDPGAKVFEFKAADRKNLAVFAELSQLAYVTKTPAHYFPLEQGMSNISAETVTAFEGGLHAKVHGIHQPFMGEGHLEVHRMGGLILGKDVPPTSRIWWLDHESRSLAESADAVTKLKDILPPLFIAQKFLNLSQEDLGQIEAMAAGSALDALLKAGQDPAPVVPAAA